MPIAGATFMAPLKVFMVYAVNVILTLKLICSCMKSVKFAVNL